MASLIDLKTNEIIYLKVKHLFGRLQSAVDNQVEGRQVSRVHASIEWTGSQWDFCDHSRNGSWLSNRQISGGQRTALKNGDTIGFEEGDQNVFKVLELDPPWTLLIDRKRQQKPMKVDPFHVLPSEENPLVSLYYKDQNWFKEKDGVSQLVETGNHIDVDGQSWLFFNPMTSELTQIAVKGQNPIDNISFEFYHSSDLESIEIVGQLGGQRIEFGVRNHNYLLLLLAKAKQTDLENQLPPHQQGWVDVSVLASQMNLDPAHLNIQVYRARKHIMSCLEVSASPEQIITRRSGEMRLAFNKFKICGTVP